jgi:hypothetical protein
MVHLKVSLHGRKNILLIQQHCQLHQMTSSESFGIKDKGKLKLKARDMLTGTEEKS